MDETVIHMFEYHAINPEEMTSEMKSKIRGNIHLYHNLLRAQILHDIPDVSLSQSFYRKKIVQNIYVIYWGLSYIEQLPQ